MHLLFLIIVLALRCISTVDSQILNWPLSGTGATGSAVYENAQFSTVSINTDAAVVQQEGVKSLTFRHSTIGRVQILNRDSVHDFVLSLQHCNITYIYINSITLKGKSRIEVLDSTFEDATTADINRKFIFMDHLVVASPDVSIIIARNQFLSTIYRSESVTVAPWVDSQHNAIPGQLDFDSIVFDNNTIVSNSASSHFWLEGTHEYLRGRMVSCSGNIVRITAFKRAQNLGILRFVTPGKITAAIHASHNYFVLRGFVAYQLTIWLRNGAAAVGGQNPVATTVLFVHNNTMITLLPDVPPPEALTLQGFTPITFLIFIYVYTISTIERISIENNHIECETWGQCRGVYTKFTGGATGLDEIVYRNNYMLARRVRELEAFTVSVSVAPVVGLRRLLFDSNVVDADTPRSDETFYPGQDRIAVELSELNN